MERRIHAYHSRTNHNLAGGVVRDLLVVQGIIRDEPYKNGTFLGIDKC